MNTITLSEQEMIFTAGSSPKGNQPKWVVGSTWYKSDSMGYEGLAEVLISRLLLKTNVENFVAYSPVKIKYGNHERSGCFSHNFLAKGEELIPLERLHRRQKGSALYAKLRELKTVEERISYTVEFVETATGLVNFGEYLTCMLELDALFLNEDRHTNNISVIYNPSSRTFRLCPYYDFGLSLLSDLEGFWMEGDTARHMERVMAKPFGSFNAQVEAAEKLYGKQLQCNFTMNHVNEILNDLSEYYRDRYRNRVRFVMERQLEK